MKTQATIVTRIVFPCCSLDRMFNFVAGKKGQEPRGKSGCAPRKAIEEDCEKAGKVWDDAGKKCVEKQ
jgi:hypothetical protein